jgi:hypothetical protein
MCSGFYDSQTMLDADVAQYLPQFLGKIELVDHLAYMDGVCLESYVEPNEQNIQIEAKYAKYMQQVPELEIQAENYDDFVKEFKLKWTDHKLNTLFYNLFWNEYTVRRGMLCELSDAGTDRIRALYDSIPKSDLYAWFSGNYYRFNCAIDNRQQPIVWNTYALSQMPDEKQRYEEETGTPFAAINDNPRIVHEYMARHDYVIPLRINSAMRRPFPPINDAAYMNMSTAPHVDLISRKFSLLLTLADLAVTLDLDPFDGIADLDHPISGTYYVVWLVFVLILLIIVYALIKTPNMDVKVDFYYYDYDQHGR